jgi:hypothetical protein
VSADQSIPYALLAFGREVLKQAVDVNDPRRFKETLRYAVFTTYFFNPDRDEVVEELSANEMAYRDAADQVLRHLRARRAESMPTQAWLDLGRQRVPPDEVQPATGYFGNAVWRPRTGGLWTSNLVDGAGTPWLDVFGRDAKAIWALDPDPALEPPRVFEVVAAESWRELVSRYPLEVEKEGTTIGGSVVELPEAPLYMPDWARVAEQWDGVHFTVEGKLRSLYVVSPIEDGFTIVQGEEAFDETLWLRWVFSNPELICEI